MNGRKHRLTKLLALTTVLTGGGVGVYQGINHGLHFGIGEKLSATLTPGVEQLRIEDESSQGTTTLDAVADVLASQSVSSNQRSASPEPEVASALADEPAGTEQVAAAYSAIPDTVGDRYSATLPSESAPPDDVARGQEPADEQFEPTSPLELPEEPAAQQASSVRARAAFSDRPPTAPQSRYGSSEVPFEGQRYGDFASVDTARAAEHADAQPAEHPIDPFARPMAPAPPVGANAGERFSGSDQSSTGGDAQPISDEAGNAGEPLVLPGSGEGSFEREALANSNHPSARSAFEDSAPNPLRASADRTNADWPAARQPASALPGGDLGTMGDDTTSAEGTGRPGEQALEGPQQPALVVEKLAPAEIQVGKPASFQVTVRNVSQRPVDAVAVHDEVPQGTRLISTSPRAEESGGKLVWQLGTLSVGEERSVEMLLMPVAEGEIGSVATVTSSTQASAKARCTLPQLALRLTAPRQVMIGSEQRVRIELHNPGTGDATGVMLYETVPEELRHSSGQALEFEIGILRSGETRELELVLTAEKRGRVVNRISARADGNLQVEQEIEFEVVGPELEVSVEGPTVRYLERPATYTVSVGNPGTAPAREIELVTHLPKGLRFVSANNLGEYDSESHAVYWSLAELPEGEAGEVELVAMPVESGEHEIKVEGRALQGLEDQTSQHVQVDGIAAIMFEVRDLEDPIEVGKDTSYEIRVVNQGTKAATGVQVRATLQPGLSILSASGETRHAIQSGAVVFEPLSSLAPKTDTVYRIQVKGVRSGDQRIAVEVSTDDIGDPIRKEESTRIFGDQ